VGSGKFQSSVRINVGPNQTETLKEGLSEQFQSSVRINVGPNLSTTASLRR